MARASGREPLELLALVFARPDQARAEAEALLASSPAPYDASIAHQAIGIIERDFGDLGAAVARLRTARRLAARSGSADREADVLATLGIALVHAGRTRQGLGALADGLAAARGVTAARVRFRRAAILWVLGRHAEGLADLRLAIPVLRRAGDTIWTARALTLRGTIRLATGAAGPADLDFAAAEALWATTDQEHDVAVAVENRGLVAARSGDIPAALTHFDEAARRYAALGTPMNVLHTERCGVLMAAGLAREALAEADRATGLLERSGGQPTRRAELLLTAARAALYAGELDVAAERATAATRLFARQRRAWWEAHARLVLAQVRFASGRVSRAGLRSLVGTAATLRELGSPEATAAALLAGRVALALGADEEAGRHLDTAARARFAGSAAARADGWLARALRAEAAGRPRAVLDACRRGLDILDEHRLTLGASELRARTAARGAELASLAQRACLAPGNSRRLLAWSERWRATTLAIPPTRPPDDPALARDLTAFRELHSRLEGTRSPALERELRRLEREIRDRTHRAGGSGREGGGRGRGSGGRGSMSGPRGSGSSGGGRESGGRGWESSGSGRGSSGRGWESGGRGSGSSGRGSGSGQGSGGARFDAGELLDRLGDRLLVEITEVDGFAHVLLCGRGRVRHLTAGRISGAVTELAHVRAGLHRLSYGGSPERLAVLRAGGARLEELLLGPAARALGDGPVVVVPPGRLHGVPWALLPSLADRVLSVSPSAGAWLRAAALPAPSGGTVLVRGPGLASGGAEVPLLAKAYGGEYGAATVLEDRAGTALEDGAGTALEDGTTYGAGAVPEDGAACDVATAREDGAARGVGAVPEGGAACDGATARECGAGTVPESGTACGAGNVLEGGAGYGAGTAREDGAVTAVKDGAVTVLESGAATAPSVLGALDGCALAHVAAHGTFRSDNPMFSALRMSDGPLTVYDLERLRRAPYRLVLPCCDSGRLEHVGADELLGLASAVLPLGTAGVVAALLPVNDAAAVPLMLAFHAALRTGRSMAEALLDARRALPPDPVHQAAGLSFTVIGAG